MLAFPLRFSARDHASTPALIVPPTIGAGVAFFDYALCMSDITEAIADAVSDAVEDAEHARDLDDATDKAEHAETIAAGAADDAGTVVGNVKVGTHVVREGETRVGAAGVQEAIYSLLMMQNGFICESANIENLDPAMADMPIVRGIGRDAAKNGNRISSFIMGVVKSTPFQYRRAEETNSSVTAQQQ